MDASLTHPQQTLNRSAIVIAVIGGISLALMVFSIVTRIGVTGAMWSFYVLQAAIVPVLYLVFAKLIAGRQYGAMVACGVIAATTLATYVVRLPFMFRYVPVTSPQYLFSLASPVVVLIAVLMARPVMVHWPDQWAVSRAKKRAAISLYIGGAMLGLIGATPAVLLIVFLSSSHNHLGNDEWFVLAIVGGFAAVFWACAAVALISARRVGRQVRASGWMVAGSVVSLLLTVLIVDSVLGGRLPYGYGYLSYFGWLIPFVFKATAVWQLIELIHARRVCEEPASFGFEPIFAKPVIALEPTLEGRATTK